jgi:ATP-dependent RNA helicase DeaD
MTKSNRKPKPGAKKKLNKKKEEAMAAAPPPAPKPPKKQAPARGPKSPQAYKSRRDEKPTRPKKEFEQPVQAAAPEPLFEPPTFAELGLNDAIVRAITELGYERPTPIQARAIPVLIEGGDLIGQAQTGTGKTAAFALPIIQKIDPALNETQALILAPTRELAVQVAGGIWDLAKHTGLRVVPVYGGQPIDRQFRSLRNGAHIVVGTPGRVLDHLRRGSLNLENVAHCTLDEADEMMALGFTEDMEAILAQLPEERQIACFSATMPPRIVDLTKKFLRSPKHVSIESKQRTLETTNQTYYEVPKGKKLEALARVLDMESPGPTIVFCRTRQETSDLSDALRLRGYNAEALHGDMNQGERDRVMRRFREGQADLLIATDVAARGLDIETVTHVINYDIPWDVEQYIHRIGRTGRAGRTGDAITLVEGRQRRQLEAIERMIGSRIKPARIPTAADIASRRRDEFKEAIRETLTARQFDGYLPTVEDLQEEFDPAEIAAAALQMLWQTRHSDAPGTEEIDHDFEQPETGMTRIYIGMGRQDGLRPGDIVGAIAGEAGLTGKAIGVIDILDRSAFVEVPASQADRVVEALQRSKVRNRKVKVQIARPPGARE